MTVSRRQFLQQGVAALVTVPLWRTGMRGTVEPDRVLVLLELGGGNDALNTVIPVDADAYYRQRPTLAIPRGEALPLQDGIGLHPALRGFRPLHEQGVLTLLQNVGYPGPDRSHFRSTDIWHTASLAPEDCPTGWIGRLADTLASRESGSVALALGQDLVPRLLVGERSKAPAIQDLEGFRLDLGEGAEAAARRAVLEHAAAGEDGTGSPALLAQVRQVLRTTYAEVDRIQQALRDLRPAVDYPDTGLGRKLCLAARCIAGRLPARVLFLRQDGYDTHARQKELHAALLAELGDAVAAFQQDLAAQRLDGRVALLISSEFGRRVQENGSLGTDHGAGGAAFLVAAQGRGGVLGGMPDLESLDGGDLRFTLDFRGIYRALLEQWLEVPSERILGPGIDLVPLF